VIDDKIHVNAVILVLDLVLEIILGLTMGVWCFPTCTMCVHMVPSLGHKMWSMCLSWLFLLRSTECCANLITTLYLHKCCELSHHKSCLLNLPPVFNARKIWFVCAASGYLMPSGFGRRSLINVKQSRDTMWPNVKIVPLHMRAKSLELGVCLWF